ncbi:MAG: creatininase family protein [Desulfarculaceae bacterium]|nr:creatininase family protein [Desulfarculaceae bacterium]
MAEKSYLMDMTWQEVAAAITPQTVVVVPLGSAELEGTHLPVGVDTIAADGVAARLAGLDNVIIGPTLPIGYSKWFLPYPGTISLEQETLIRVLEDYARSLERHGVQRLVFLNSHKGNNAAVETVAHTLVDEFDMKVGMLNVWQLAGQLTAKTELVVEGGFRHGGEIMASLMLALRPETVVKGEMRPDAVKQDAASAFTFKNSLGDAEFEGAVQTVFRDIRDVTDTGTMGDPSAGSAQRGEAILDLVAGYAKRYLAEFSKL